jgi:hypothetical protein
LEPPLLATPPRNDHNQHERQKVTRRKTATLPALLARDLPAAPGIGGACGRELEANGRARFVMPPFGLFGRNEINPE